MTELLVLAALAAPALPEGVELVPGTFDAFGRPDGNSVLWTTRSGLIVFDTGRHPAFAEALVARAGELARPVSVVVNSHWHLDHVSGNPIVLAASPEAEVWGSAALVGEQAHTFLARGRERMRAAQAEEADPAAKEERERELARSEAMTTFRLDHPIERSGWVRLDGRRLWLGLADHAASEGDVWIYDGRTGVLASGDLVTFPAPFLDTACPSSFLDAVRELDRRPFEVLIPGHGAPMDHDGFRRYLAAVEALYTCAATDTPAKACAEGWARDAGPLMSEAEARDAVEYAEYYVDQRIRLTPEALAEDCEAG